MTLKGLILLGFVAVILALTGLSMTFLWLFQAHETQRRIERKQNDIRTLATLSKRLAQGQSAVALYESLPDFRPVDPMAAIRSIMPMAQAEVRDLGALPGLSGWQRHRVTVSLRDLTCDDVVNLTRTFETGRPPWRVTALSLQAGQKPGCILGVTLTLEAMEKTR